MTITIGLNASQTQQVRHINSEQRDAIAGKAQANAISADKMVFFAVFDGTNNTLINGGDVQPTNAAQLSVQAVAGSSNIAARYFEGPGTPGTLLASSWLSPQVTRQAIRQAENAYRQFEAQAGAWVKDGRSFAVAIASFSRGGASAAIFTQMLYERGLTDPDDRTRVLVAPGQLTVSAGVLFDPVLTGVSGNMAFAPTVTNVVDILARDEYRFVFQAADYRNHPGITSVPMFGAHSDIGGAYDNGIGAQSLEAATEFLRNSGLGIDNVPSARRFDPSAPYYIHSEGDRWSEYGSFGSTNLNQNSRLFVNVATPATSTMLDGLPAKTLRLFDGRTITITDSAGGFEKVQTESTITSEVERRELRTYRIEASETRLLDKIEIRKNTQSGLQSIEVEIFDPNHLLTIKVPSAQLTTLSIAGPGGEVALGNGLVLVQGQSQVAVTGGKFKRTGSAELSTWEDSTSGFIYSLAGGTPGDGKGDLKITVPGIGDGGQSSVLITNFKNGTLGISLEDQQGVTATAESSVLREGGATAVTLNFESIADQVRTYRLAVSDLGDKLSAVLGSDTVSFASGEIEVTLPVGASEVHLALIQRGDIDASSSIELTAALLSADGSISSSSAITLNIDATVEANPVANPSLTNTIVGDLAPRDFSDEPGIQAQADEWGNVITEGPEPDRKDVLFDTLGNDEILAGGGEDLVIASRGGDNAIDVGAGDDKVSVGGAGSNRVEGRAGNDNLNSGGGRDQLFGGEGNDALYAGEGDDLLDGGTGTDVLDGGLGEDVVRGGEGNDYLLGFNFSAFSFTPPTVAAGETLLHQGNDWLIVRAIQNPGGEEVPVTLLKGFADASNGDDGADTFEGGAGDDVVWAGAGDDRIEGGEGDDELQGMGGADHIEGGEGADSIFGDEIHLSQYSNFTPPEAQGDDFIDGGDGDDALRGQGGSDTLLGGEGADALMGDTFALDQLAGEFHGADFLDGGAGDDTLIGNGGADALFGGEGNDQMQGDGASGEITDGDDYLDGEAGNDLLVGQGGSDTLYGGEGDDELQGDAETTPEDQHMADEFFGEAGADTVFGGGGDDLLDGGADDDLLFGNEGDDLIEGGDGADQLTGGEGDDFVSGGRGADRLFGEEGDDLLLGGEGADEIVGNEGDDVLEGGEGGDQLFGAEGDDLLDAGTGDDIAQGGAGDDSIAGGDGIDTLVGEAGDDALDGGAGNDVMSGGEGEDALAGGAGDDEVQGGEGSDALDAGEGNDRLFGDAGNDTLSGGEGNDLVSGGEGNDVLEGGSGNDALGGHQGDDFMSGGEGDDSYAYDFADGGRDTISDSGGSDTLTLIGLSSQNIHIGLGSLVFSDGTPGNELHIEGFDPEDALGTLAIETFILDDGVFTKAELLEAFDIEITGTPQADVLTGTSSHDTIRALESDDVVVALGGNDTIDPGAGADQVCGGEGDDTYLLADADDEIFENPGEGIDEVNASVTIALADEVENLTLLEAGGAIDGTGNASVNFITGNSFANSLVGSGDSDVLHGGGGDDVLYGADEIALADAIAQGADGAPSPARGDFISGHAGADTLVGSELSDLIAGGAGADTIAAGAGNDYIFGAGDYSALDTGWAVVETETPAGTLVTFEHVVGFDSVDEMGDVVHAGGGADFVVGGRGADTIHAEAGEDRVFAGGGDDAITGGSGGDVLVGDNGEEFLDPAFHGNDTIEGGEGGDIILGNRGNDTIDGGAHGDLIDGGRGDDTLLGGEGDDAIYADIFQQVGDVDPAITGDDFLDGGAGNDRLFGQHGSDTLFGGAGNDIVQGDSGADEMHGGAGDDRIFVDHAGDAVFENENEGNDTVAAHIDYELGANLENLQLFGTAARGTGNALDNRIAGNTIASQLFGMGGNDELFGSIGADTLDGGTGDDVMRGGAGDDSYYVDSAGDSAFEDERAGTDTVYSSAAVATIFGAIENLVLLEGAIAGFGSERDNSITGNELANILAGGGGLDTLAGGAGDDTYYAELDDAIVEAHGGGTDTVVVTTGYTLGHELENLTLADFDAVRGTGNTANNVIIGSLADNRLFGLEGADTLTDDGGHDRLDGGLGADSMSGGSGDDVYIVDHGEDVVTESPFAGTDLVEASVTHTLSADVENLTLTGATGFEALGGTGNELDNVIIGNAGANVLRGLDGADTITGNDGDDALEGGAGNDTLEAGAGDDALDGGADNDVLDGGIGADLMTGGQGDDTYYVDNLGDITDETGTGGHDTVFSSITHELGQALEDLYLTGFDDIDGTGNDSNNLIVGNEGDNPIAAFGGHDHIAAKDGDDTIDAGEGDDLIEAGAGDDTVTGDDGNDTLDGGSGIDALDGGDGDDVYRVDSFFDAVSEAGGEGFDSVFSTDSFVLPDNVESLRLLGDFSANPSLPPLDGTGNALDNQITGSDGDNSLAGLDGNDNIDARAGNDFVTGDEGDDFLYGGSDAVFRVDDGYGGYGGYGGSPDLLATNADQIFGGAGNDTIDGGSDNDQLYGDEGNDYLFGGNDGLVPADGDGGYGGYGGYGGGRFLSNDDLLFGGAGDDTLDGGSGNDTLQGGEGADSLFGGFDGSLNISNNDVLDGGAGIDAMAGGSGDDTYYVDGFFVETTDIPVYDDCGNLIPGAVTRVWTTDSVTEFGGQGSDMVYSAADYTLTDAVETLILLDGTEARIGRGNDLDNTIQGNSADNLLEGQDGADSLFGNDGNDVLIGDGGDDFLDGGEGDDTYKFGAGSGRDTVSNGGGGFDVVRAFQDVTPDAFSLSRSGNDVTIAVLGSPDRMRLVDWFGGSNSVQAIVFCGDTWDATEIADFANAHQLNAADDSGSVQEDGTLVASGNVFGNDTGTGPIGTITVRNPGPLFGAFGMLVVAADGSYSYELFNEAVQFLAEGQSTTEVFAYEAEDEGGASASALIRIDIAGANDGPATLGDFALVSEDEAPSAAGSVLDNDFDIDSGTVLTVSDAGMRTGLYGTLFLNADGSYEYQLDNVAAQPFAAGDSFIEEFGYTASDGMVGTASVLTVSIAGTNDAPATVDDAASVVEDDAPGVIGNVLANDTDVDSGSFLFVSNPHTYAGAYGTLVLSSDGSYGYQLNNNAVQSLAAGEVITDVFGYSASDGMAETPGLLTVTVTGTNDAPVTLDDAAMVFEDDAPNAAGNVLANDTDVDNGPVLTVSDAGTRDGAYGTLFLNADGSYEYELDSGAVQALGAGQPLTDAFAYTASDGITGTGGLLTVSILGTNDAPVTTADAASASEDGVLNAAGNVLANDTDPDNGTMLSVANAGVYFGAYGSLMLNADGSYSYELYNETTAVQSLAAGESASDLFSYVAFDGIASTPGLLTIDITGANDAPFPEDDAASVFEDEAPSAAGNVLANDSDIDSGAVLTISDHGTRDGAYGTLFLNTDGSYEYQLDNDAVQVLAAGDFVTESFSYTASDGTAGTPAELTVTIFGTNDAPTAPDDNAGVSEDGVLTVPGNALANDTDIDDGALPTVTNARTYLGTYGSLTLESNGDYTYTLRNAAAAVQALAVGTSVTDSFAYFASDGDAQTRGFVRVVIAGANDAPVTRSDAASVSEDGATSASGNVLANDHDRDSGAVLSVANAGNYAGAHGTLTLNADGSYSYQLDNAAAQSLAFGELVTDAFGYMASDGMAQTAGTLTVSIAGTNDAPAALSDAASVSEDGVLGASGNVLGNDRDLDKGAVLTVANHGTYAGTYGTLTLNADGSYAYALDNAATQVLAQHQTESEVFTYLASDGLESAAAQLRISVAGANDAPTVAHPIADQEASAGTAFSFAFETDTFADIDQGDILGYTASGLPGWLAFDAINREFTGTPDVAGTFTIRVTATDLAGASAFDDFILDVTADDCHGEIIIGTDGNDVLVGTPCDDIIDGRKGFDRMSGGDGDDIYYVDKTCLPKHGDKGNEGVGNGEDPPPPGHDENQNDGPGTSPGNPGSQGGHHHGDDDDDDHDHDHDDDDDHDDDCDDDHHGTHCKVDEVIEQANDGYDIVYASTDYTLPANVEEVRLLGGEDLEASGNSLANVLVGNSGDNRLKGGLGSDTYVHGFHGGDDVIEETGPQADTLLFGEGITADMARVRRRQDDLIVDLGGPHGSVTVKGWFASSSKRVESIQFADGTTWNEQQIRSRAQQHHDDDDDHHGEGHHDGGDHGGNGHDDDDDHHGGHDGDSKDKHDDDKRHHSYAWGGGRQRFDFEELHQLLGRDGGALSTDELGRRWAAVWSYADGEVEDQGAAPAHPRGWLAGLLGFGYARWGFEGSTGAARGADELKRFEGLTEGFRQL